MSRSENLNEINLKNSFSVTTVKKRLQVHVKIADKIIYLGKIFSDGPLPFVTIIIILSLTMMDKYGPKINDNKLF